MPITATERFWTTLVRDSVRYTGKSATFTLRIVRSSDGYMYDWSDATFKASGWTTLNKTATEHSAANNPGAYYWDIGASATIDHILPSAFAVDDEYLFEASETTLPYQAAWSCLVRKRRMSSMLFAQMVVNNRKLSEGSSANSVVYEDDGVTVLVSKNVTDKNAGAVVLAPGIPAQES